MIVSILNNYTLSSYNMHQKVDIIHSIHIEISYTQFRPRRFEKEIYKCVSYSIKRCG